MLRISRSLAIALALAACTTQHALEDNDRFGLSLGQLNDILAERGLTQRSSVSLTRTGRCQVRLIMTWGAAPLSERGWVRATTMTSFDFASDVKAISLTEQHDDRRSDHTERWYRAIRIEFESPVKAEMTYALESSGAETRDSFSLEFVSVGGKEGAPPAETQRALALLHDMRDACKGQHTAGQTRAVAPNYRLERIVVDKVLSDLSYRHWAGVPRPAQARR
jgi:hypothetical protein